MEGNLEEISNFWGIDFNKIELDGYHEMLEKGDTKENIDNVEKVEKIEKIENVDGKVASKQEKVNKTLENRIENMRLKYLVGKIVGEDLMDNKGIVIASKNVRITEELINIADKQGKLAELILNMIFPEAEE